MKKTYFLGQVYLLIFVFFLESSCTGQTTSNATDISSKPVKKSISKKIDEIISIYNYNEGFNGSVLIAQDGEVVFKNSYGKANREWNLPNKADTKFRIASLTKPFTAILILQLVAENTLELNKPISTYLKDFPKENGNQITIHHLLTHSSGLVRDIKIDEKQFHSPKELVDLFANEPLQFTPGERFEYSNNGYILLGYLIETITGKTYKKVLEEKIFSPLNMKNSGYYRHKQLLENRSSGYSNNFIDYQNANYTDFSNAFSAGAIYSTVEDIFLFDQALYSETLLSKKFLDLAFRKQIADTNYGGYYGYGWEIIEKTMGSTNDKIETISHSGSLPDYCAIFTRIPSTKTTVILLSNTGRAYLNAITKSVIGILNNQTYEIPKKSAAKLLLELIGEKGIESGISHFQKIKADNIYYVDENEMNILSYKFLQENKIEIAASVLKIAIAYFPNAFNLYDSYGEVLLMLGEKEKAIENYRKSVEINPNNKHGIEVLKELEITKNYKGI